MNFLQTLCKIFFALALKQLAKNNYQNEISKRKKKAGTPHLFQLYSNFQFASSITLQKSVNLIYLPKVQYLLSKKFIGTVIQSNNGGSQNSLICITSTSKKAKAMPKNKFPAYTKTNLIGVLLLVLASLNTQKRFHIYAFITLTIKLATFAA